MTRTTLLAAVLLLAACRTGQEDGSPMAGMTAEEHARMMAGGGNTAVDTSGVSLRQPVFLSPAEERALGVVYLTVRRSNLNQTIRTVGTIEAPESEWFEVTSRVSGFVERLPVNTTGYLVRQHEELASIYSPTVVSAQEELLTARKLALSLGDSAAGESAARAWELVAAGRRRLLWWEVPQDWLTEVEVGGIAQRRFPLRSPKAGIVMEKLVTEGQSIASGMPLFRLADLSTVWVEGDVFEQDLRFVREGAEAHVEVSAYPADHFMGKVSFIYPILDPSSRTNRIRLVMPNPSLRLRPGMFATIYLDIVIGQALMVPASAVIITGERNIVFVRTEQGMLEPRLVVTGARAGGEIEIVEGLEAGETIVRSANFLVDAESRLGGGAGSMPGMQHGAGDTTTASPEKPGHLHD